MPVVTQDIARCYSGGRQNLDRPISYDITGKTTLFQEKIMAKKRIPHTPRFKAKVAVAAIRRGKNDQRVGK